MEIDLFDLLSTSHLLVLFLVLGFGYLIGNIRIGTFRLGATAGVLLAGLAFGHMGLGGASPAQEIGFILFIYSVGLQAGPRFFSVFLQDGLKYVSLAVVVAVTSVVVAVFLAQAVGFSAGHTAGLLAGALTSTPTLAAAQDAVKSGLAPIPEGLTAFDMSQQISIGYAITYIFGLIGLILFVKWIPMLLRIELKDEAKKLGRERRFRTEEPDPEKPEMHMVRAYKVENPDVVGKRLDQLTFCKGTMCVFQELKRGDEVLKPTAATVIEQGDKISVAGSMEKLARLEKHLGEEVKDADLFTSPIETIDVVITHQDAAGKSLADLHILSRFGCYVTRITRSQIKLPVSPDMILEKGDVVRVTGMRHRLAELVPLLGHEERNIVETDLLTFAFGIAGGILLGKITLTVGAVHLSLGSAGGLLFSGILVGFLRSMHPTFGRVPPAARWVFMEFGLMLFMAGVGLKAGGGILDALLSVGPSMFLCGIMVTTAPVLVGYAFGRKVLKFNPALLLGALTGAMTSTPALNIVTERAGSHLPALGYAGTYAFANVFLALAGTLILLF
ncbi:transporter [Oceanidesulfovibrio indonesiensis]|uniref:Transporter n=1 Tax=Oceanidesulfovibrio indonesiensis TaxID=54767 RepID=A0A7M3MBH8_9BACT|nr:TrkA C-terminal domain-containing protein [Oceanidesulfovibrio indonesiensis]TVM15543.1 transporter [Oceanidesulfovibrio indonesiensis]